MVGAIQLFKQAQSIEVDIGSSIELAKVLENEAVVVEDACFRALPKLVEAKRCSVECERIN